MNRTFLAVLFVLFISITIAGQATIQAANIDSDSGPNYQILRTPIERNLIYQGILRNGDGDPVTDGSYSITFRVYNSISGGVPLWTSDSQIVSTIDGLFTIDMGQVILPFDTTYYLTLQVLGDTEMPQRQKLALAPYAASADTSLYAFNANRAFTAQRADTATFAYLSGTSAFSLNAARADTAMFAFWADSANFAFNSAQAESAAYAEQASLSDSSTYSDISGFAIHSDTAIYAWISLGYSHWSGIDSVLYTNGYWGLAKGGAGNGLMGDSSHTMVNLGVICTTGVAGQHYFYTTVGGGVRNKASRNYVTIGGGTGNTASADMSTISGGGANIATGDGSVIGGGEYNDALGAFSAVGGGYDNQARDIYGFVGGGQWNSANEDYTTIAGGYSNAAGGYGATSVGGVDNHANSGYSTIAGGNDNSVGGIKGTISGGEGNRANGESSAIGGGRINIADGLLGGIFAGSGNHAGDDVADTASFVGGGVENSALGKYSLVGGGLSNIASGSWSVIGGGWDNEATALESVIGGGNQNLAAGATSTIAGGQGNTTSDEFTTIGGGASNTASYSGATIGGGSFNTASNADAAVGGGYDNDASGWRSVVAGGTFNEAAGQSSTIAGGDDNQASGMRTSIGGGFHNLVAGDYSVIPGGYSDTITAVATYSMVFGRSAYANTSSRVIFYDGAGPGRVGINRDDRDGGISYPIHVGTSTTNGNGAYLTGAGVWTNGSSRTFKENFTPFNGADLLSKIANLSITTYNYINTTEKHIGPVAEDFVGAFDVGAIRENDGQRDNMYLSSGDVAGVALAGVQELLKKIEALENKNAELEKRIGELESGR